MPDLDEDELTALFDCDFPGGPRVEGGQRISRMLIAKQDEAGAGLLEPDSSAS